MEKTRDSLHTEKDMRDLPPHLSRIEQNEEVMSTLMSWIVKPRGILFLSGKVGNGKTYIAQAWKNHLIENHKIHRFYHQISMTSDIKNYISKNWNPLTELERLCETYYFILDDLGHGANTDFNNEAMIHFIETRYNSKFPTLITSNLWKNELKEQFSDRIVSRIFDINNTIIRLDGPDRRQTKWK